MRVQFQTPEHALIASRVLSVDDELQPSKVEKTLATEGATLVGNFRASEARVLRVVLSSFYDMLGVVVRSLREFS